VVIASPSESRSVAALYRAFLEWRQYAKHESTNNGNNNNNNNVIYPIVWRLSSDRTDEGTGEDDDSLGLTTRDDKSLVGLLKAYNRSSQIPCHHRLRFCVQQIDNQNHLVGDVPNLSKWFIPRAHLYPKDRVTFGSRAGTELTFI
jgi:hypothetical protein